MRPARLSRYCKQWKGGGGGGGGWGGGGGGGGGGRRAGNKASLHTNSSLGASMCLGLVTTLVQCSIFCKYTPQN